MGYRHPQLYECRKFHHCCRTTFVIPNDIVRHEQYFVDDEVHTELYKAGEFDETMLKSVASFTTVVNPLGYGDRIVRAGETDPVFAVPTLARAAALHTELDEAKIIEHRALILDLVRSFQRAHARKNEGVYAQYGALRYASNRYVGSILRLILPADATGNRNQRVSDNACGVKENRAYVLANPADPKVLWLTREMHAVSRVLHSRHFVLAFNH